MQAISYNFRCGLTQDIMFRSTTVFSASVLLPYLYRKRRDIVFLVSSMWTATHDYICQ